MDNYDINGHALQNITKYPKSKNNFQCLGPCYQPGTMVVHPTQLEMVTDHAQPFCPVDEWTYVDQKTGKTTDIITDICFNPTEKANISNRELELNILTPYIDFNSEQFLKIYYNIFSFEDSMDWIDRHKFVPIGTKIRIINSSLNTFGEKIDLFDNRFVDFFIELIKKKEIKRIYKKINSYIGIDKNSNVHFVNNENNNLKPDDECVERMNYLIKIFLDKDETTKFLSKYFRFRKTQWTDIRNHLDNMIIDFSEYIQTKINITIQIK